MIISLRMFKIFSHTYKINMALKFFPETVLLLKVDRFEGILNRNKIDEIVNDHSSSCIS